jgi:prepilin-type processing-associated H-X9-DG protein
MRSGARIGFSLIEALVVIGIIATAIGLIVPAVMRIRAAADRTKCSNNLRQVALAAHSYHDAIGVFPPGVRFRNGSDPQPLLAWAAHLLPYLEQADLATTIPKAYSENIDPFADPPHVGLSTVLPTLICASDGRVDTPQTSERTNNTVALSSYLGSEGKDLFSRDGIFFVDSRTRLSDITDGSSNTLFIGERPPSRDFQFGWWYAGAGQQFTGSVDMVLGVEEQNILPSAWYACPIRGHAFRLGSLTNDCDMFHFWSLHPGGANFAFADGSVHFLSYSGAAIMPALATRAGGEIVSY